ncbi:MAG: PD-(D/E)XK nuclease family protein [Prevotella sp.]|nr:PD-(D/E)XK nuclease family protein [Prevotella sp.]
MNTFLKTVAEDLLRKTNGQLADVTVVFPNKRASLFFNQALIELSDKPVWCPRYVSLDDIFASAAELKKADHIWLVFELYKVYREVTGFNETLDEFYNWGELMLADFDDVDKHLADARQVFSLIGDLHALDTVDYLTEEQRKVLQQFFSTFTDDHESQLKQRFVRLWNKFYDIYTIYNERLRSQGMAYEGMLYRSVTQIEPQPYVFVGFNLLNEVERRLFSQLAKEGCAKFYWDFDDYYVKAQKHHEAGKYINEHLRNFPNELDYDSPVYHRFLKDKKLSIVSSATDDLQARYIARWLTPERISAGRRTAIVLADEQLLETVLHCLPPEVKHVNITTGYPLAQSPVASFVRILMSMHARKSHTLHSVNALLRHPYAKYVSDKAGELHERLNTEVIYYPSIEDLALDDNLRRLFTPADDMNQHLMWAVRTVAQNIREENNDFHNEGLFRMYTILNRLQSVAPHPIDSHLYSRLLTQIIQSTSIPFHGEPIEGIQIMGVLETRNLDFDHLLILSCNEGNLPAKVSDSSFIPHSVRRAYNLTTVENKVGIYSYYFHRLLSRCEDATMLYNNSTEDGRTGEMSRFMLQLLAESGLHIERYALSGGQTAGMSHPKPVQKTSDMVRKLLDGEFFSPSAMGRYLRCQLSFYYAYVKDIRENDESDEEEMDNRMFGNIFHRAAELLYKEHLNRPVTAEYLEGLLNERGHVTLQRYVDSAIRTELFRITDDMRKTPKLGGLQVVNREMVLRFLVMLLRHDIRHAPITVLGVEKKVRSTIEINTADGCRAVNIGGTIDRLDCVTDEFGNEQVRVIDYKTGTPPLNGIAIGSIADIFDPSQIGKHSDYYLQALLYSGIMISKGEQRPISPAVLYIQKTTSEDYSPRLLIGYEPHKGKGYPILDAAQYIDEFYDGVRKLLEEICDDDVPFVPTDDVSRCTFCPYHGLCYT